MLKKELNALKNKSEIYFVQLFLKYNKIRVNGLPKEWNAIFDATKCSEKKL